MLRFGSVTAAALGIAAGGALGPMQAIAQGASASNAAPFAVASKARPAASRRLDDGVPQKPCTIAGSGSKNLRPEGIARSFGRS
jgi:hypothetical protein